MQVNLLKNSSKKNPQNVSKSMYTFGLVAILDILITW